MRRPFWNANTHYHSLVIRALPPGTLRVLDVGCGDGILSADLVRSGIPQVVAIDVDRGVLERARARHHDLAIEWRLGDVNAANFEAGSLWPLGAFGADRMATAIDLWRHENPQREAASGCEISPTPARPIFT